MAWRTKLGLEVLPLRYLVRILWVPRISSASRHQVIFMDESAKTIRPT